MPGFDSIIGQRLAVRLLQTFLQNDTLPHALLFTGKAGVGKRKTATLVAMALNCNLNNNRPADTIDTIRPCGRCRPCRQILAGSHPDAQLVEPQGPTLKIEQVRQIIHTLALKPFGDNQRVVIIADAHHMTTEAANSLLKVLEEPPEHTTLILTALQRSDLLPTIVSRCRAIRFNPLSPSDLTTLLSDTLQVDTPQAELIASLADGSYEQARKMFQSQWHHQRDWLIRAAGLDQATQDQRQSISLALTFAAQLASRKTQIQELLALLKTWIRDLSIVAHWPEGIINKDKQMVLQKVCQHLDSDRCITLWEAVEKAQKDIAAKANLRLTLDIMALTMFGHNRSGRAPSTV